MRRDVTLSLAFIALLVSASGALAQQVDSVILSTDSNCPDALVTGAAANKIGAPVLVTGSGSLSEDAATQIEEIAPSTVYIVGGPAVVSESVESSLAEDYNVVRLWGLTRYGTAAEVALEFWESSDKVMLVTDSLGAPSSERCEVISEAKDLAIQEGIPVLLISSGSIPDQVVDALEELGPSEAIIVGNAGTAVTDTLETLGIEVGDTIEGADVNATRTLLRERIREKVREMASGHMVVVAVGSWSDTVRAPYVPNGTSRLISSEDQIDDLIDEIGELDYEEIDVVGKPELAQVIYDRLTDAGIDARLVSGTPPAVAAKIMEKQLQRIRERAAAVKNSIEEMCRKRVGDAEGGVDALVQRVRSFVAGSALSNTTKSRWTNWLSEKQQSFDSNAENGSYCRAWNDYGEMQRKMADLTYKYRQKLASAYQNMVMQETRLTKAVQELRDAAMTIREKVAAISASKPSDE